MTLACLAGLTGLAKGLHCASQTRVGYRKAGPMATDAASDAISVPEATHVLGISERSAWKEGGSEVLNGKMRVILVVWAVIWEGRETDL